ncbi:MAG: dTDP-4-dehydrorhamnose 3,5-epimerase [Prolixibacteraceae bacterium]|nr:dTDP-4-dehydrorhamnose 3,5-epimerase [Prolixibacteraceae bacterium]
METEKTGLPGLILIKPRVFEDLRGYFFETYQKERYLIAGIENDFVQDNESMSGYGVVRGLHYQLEPFSQAKLVRVISGKVFDVAVDLRKNSPTFGKWEGFELSSENKNQLLIPAGFAHGFSVLSENVILTYKCDNLYSKNHERGIRFDDPDLNIDWKIPLKAMIVSEKDANAPGFKDCETNFIFKG